MVAAVILNENGHILLQLRDQKKEIRSPGKWSLPGGFRKPTESSLQAVKREIYEETNLELTRPFFFATLIDVFEDLPYISIDFYFDRIKTPYALEVNEGQELRFYDLSDFVSLNTSRHIDLICLYANQLFKSMKSD